MASSKSTILTLSELPCPIDNLSGCSKGPRGRKADEAYEVYSQEMPSLRRVFVYNLKSKRGRALELPYTKSRAYRHNQYPKTLAELLFGMPLAQCVLYGYFASSVTWNRKSVMSLE